jgi:hypothetical protein
MPHISESGPQLKEFIRIRAKSARTLQAGAAAGKIVEARFERGFVGGRRQILRDMGLGSTDV